MNNKEINIYCDESCHLEHDGSNIMVLGAVCCSKSKIKEISTRIAEIKERNGINKNVEIKWTKISNTNVQLYKDIINYFFDDDDIHFRCLIADKQHLKHDAFNQTHDDWYYKMYFLLLNMLFNKYEKYNIYLDIKDVFSYKKCQKLLKVIGNQNYDFEHQCIKKIQSIRSYESQIIQITDILIGAVGYKNRADLEGKRNSKSKKELVELIKSRSGYSLIRSTYLTDKKFNMFFWEGK